MEGQQRTEIRETANLRCCVVPISRWVDYVALAIIGGGLDLWTKEAIFRWRGLPGQKDVWWLIDGYFRHRNGRQHWCRFRRRCWERWPVCNAFCFRGQSVFGSGCFGSVPPDRGGSPWRWG